MIIINKLLSPEWENFAHGPEGYYFAENGATQLKQIALSAARALSGEENPETRPYPQEELDKIFPFAVCCSFFLMSVLLTVTCIADSGIDCLERHSQVN